MAITVSTATVWLGVGLLALLVTTAVLTVGRSVIAARRDKSRATVRDRLKDEVLATIAGKGPDWDTRDLEAVERTVLMEVLHTHLRLLRGDARDRLANIALTLDLDDRARKRVRTGTPPQQRAALHFLTVLGAPVDADELLEHCDRPMTSRVAATETLLEQPDPDVERLLEFLLSTGEPLSQRGMDVLLELCHREPTLVLTYAADTHHDWSRQLLIQVLTVIGHGFPQTIDEPLAWVIDIAIPGSGFVFQDTVDLRVAAITALEPYGWRTDLRRKLEIDRLLDDPAPRIRQATYELLGAWGDDVAVEILSAALTAERHDRARLHGANALYPHRPQLEPTTDVLADTWRWVRASAEAMEVA